MKKETVVLNNLNCPSCAAELQKAFQKMPGVKEANVAFATGTLTLEYDEGSVTPEQVEKTVQSFGLSIATRM